MEGFGIYRSCVFKQHVPVQCFFSVMPLSIPFKLSILSGLFSVTADLISSKLKTLSFKRNSAYQATCSIWVNLNRVISHWCLISYVCFWQYWFVSIRSITLKRGCIQSLLRPPIRPEICMAYFTATIGWNLLKLHRKLHCQEKLCI